MNIILFTSWTNAYGVGQDLMLLKLIEHNLKYNMSLETSE